ncbi:MAG: 50S ribosomal protein L15 [Patescibacteria group bacterium]
MLSTLPKITKKNKKRVGRGAGSGKGAKSTRGTTRHQKAREKIPLHFEGGQAKMVKKYPLLRGKGKNKSVQETPVIVTLTSLNVFKDGDVIDLKTLAEKNLIKNVSKMTRVKILANGLLEKKLTIKLPISKKAKELVEKAGGSTA